ncbi:solute carrier family 35, member E3 [Trypanosoma theileri]|uniref:Solute carrier family 35, member E3 n=1 Tax=Trypanosoma theileri TaxID=67003 RepID=A0A1X0P5Z4_9TRYP|nr:solute carrier family 35, member E3 [Trypanosoma theileri]ORC92357.1 solute carrier family 35, member E3 [Trypanosoma theileri]
MFTFSHRLLIPFYLALNAFSSITIVFINKWIFEDHDFRGSITLTLIHFVVTFLGLLLSLACGVFEPKRISIIRVLPLSISFCGFVVLTNMSLLYNSVGFYQLIKVLTTPLLVVMETFIYRQTFSTKIKLSLALICIGVAIATVTDSEVNLTGVVIALSALLVTCQYQIWVGTKQKELECDSCQLLFYQAPLSALLLVPIAYFVEGPKLIYPCSDTVMVILFSGVVAFLVNISIFLVIGKTSPVTYNVLGHFKLCVILFFGYFFFGGDMNVKKLLGVILTLAGVFWYTHLKTASRALEEESIIQKDLDKDDDKMRV